MRLFIKLLLSALISVVCADVAAAQPVVSHSSPGIYTYAIQTTGTYTVVATGAQGGDETHFGRLGGKGAQVSGTVHLSAGDLLTLVVGGRGVTGTDAGGGGGGTFVYVTAGSRLLVAAGGGGGANYDTGLPGLASTSGADGVNPGGIGVGAGGQNGSGGQGSSDRGSVTLRSGGGGAGWLSAGGDAYNYPGSGGSTAPTFSGGVGGGFGPSGGVGGGGAASFFGGGGGGGYSGGGGGGGLGGAPGGGGGSFTDPAAQNVVAQSGIQSGDGSVVISLLAAAPAPVPTMTEWALILFGLMLAGAAAHAIHRRRQLHWGTI